MMSVTRPSLREHLILAELNWAKSVRKRHDVIEKDYGNAENMPVFPCHIGPPGQEDKYWRETRNRYTIWDFTPPSFSPPFELERVGRLGDGGKWVCGMSRYEVADRRLVIYSLGIGDDSSWENELLSRTNCEIWGYDFTVNGFVASDIEPEYRLRTHFSKAGVAGKTDTRRDPPFYTLQDLMKQNGHDYMQVTAIYFQPPEPRHADNDTCYSDILKVDIETSEFSVFESFCKAFPEVLPVGQLLIEVHLEDPIEVFHRKPERPKSTSKSYLDWFERLEARGLRPVSMDLNMIAITLTGAGEKAGGPILNEYTFINVYDKQSLLLGGVTV